MPIAAAAREQALGEHGGEVVAPGACDLLCCSGREEREDAVERLRRVDRVHASTSRGGRSPSASSAASTVSRVAHLADEDHVRALAQRVAQALGEVPRSVPTSRWLITQRSSVKSSSIGSSSVIDVPLGVRRSCAGSARASVGRLARAGDARDQHDPALAERDALELLDGKPSARECGACCRDRRSTTAGSPICLYALRRKRPRPSSCSAASDRAALAP
jgi:hypothetical protein